MEVHRTIQVFDEEKEDVYSIVNKIVSVGNQKEGFFLCNVSELVSRYNSWKNIFPKVDIFYAVKCNDSRIVLETLATLGIGFSCVSREEIRKVISIGVPPNKIIFANPTKKISHIVYAADVGVTLLTFDNEEELYKIKTHHPSAELILRIATKEPSDNPTFVRKYGAPSGDAKHILSMAKSLNLDVVGVVFHLESSTGNIKEYIRAIEESKIVFDTGCKLGYDFKIVDIGGGYSGKNEALQNIAAAINESLAKHFPSKEIKFIAEPGTYCVERAFKIISVIHSKRIMPDETRMYHLDIGVYNGLSPVIFKKFFACKPLKETSKTLYPSMLWGPTCDSTDKISEDVDYLPEMEIGDWVIFEDTGVYTMPLTYEFNGFPLPNIHPVVTKEDWLLLAENVPGPTPKSKFALGESLDNYLTGLNIPYIYNSLYY